MKAMIFAAGLGTRLKPLTDSMPKALVPVAGKPLIQHVIEKLTAAGYDDFVVNIHHFADMLENWLMDYQKQHADIRITCSSEREQLLETGGGIAHAAPLLKENNPQKQFLIHNVDILSNIDLQQMRNSTESKVERNGARLVVSERETERYLIFDENMRLVGWTNVKTGEVKTPFPAVREAFDPTYTAPVDSANRIISPFFRPFGSGPYFLYAFSGIHEMSTGLLDMMDKWPQKFSIIEFYLSICNWCPIYGYVQPDLKLMDVGKIDSLDKAEEFVNI